MRDFSGLPGVNAAIASAIQTPELDNNPAFKLISVTGSGGYYRGETNGETIIEDNIYPFVSACTIDGVEYLAYRTYSTNKVMLGHKVNGIWTAQEIYSGGGYRPIGCAAYDGDVYVAYVDSDAHACVWCGGVVQTFVAHTATTVAIIATSHGIYMFTTTYGGEVSYYYLNATHSTWTEGSHLDLPYPSYNGITVGMTSDGLAIYPYYYDSGDYVQCMSLAVETPSGLQGYGYDGSYGVNITQLVHVLVPEQKSAGIVISPAFEVEYGYPTDSSTVKMRKLSNGIWSAWETCGTGVYRVCATGGNFYVTGALSAGAYAGVKRYSYSTSATDLSPMVVSAKIDETNDNPVQQINLTLAGGENTFDSIVIGMKLMTFLRFGTLDPIPMGVFYVDSVSYSAMSPTVSVSARNAIGYLLKSSTYGRSMTITMTGASLIQMLCGLVGIENVVIQGLGISASFNLTSQSFYDNIIKVVTRDLYRMVEMPDGTIAIGSPEWLSANYRANGTYIYSIGQLFTRNKTKSVDAVDSHFGATKNGYTNVTEISNFDWKLPVRYIFPDVPPTVSTQADFDAWCADQLSRRQYIGKTESYSGPMRPQLQTGDVAQLGSTVLGIVTKVTHEFSASGFKTSFSVDSGGTIMTSGGTTTTKNIGAEGYNRKQTMTDIVRVVAKEAQA